jgi:RHS repeat-associated protein
MPDVAPWSFPAEERERGASERRGGRMRLGSGTPRAPLSARRVGLAAAVTRRSTRAPERLRPREIAPVIMPVPVRAPHSELAVVIHVEPRRAHVSVDVAARKHASGDFDFRDAPRVWLVEPQARGPPRESPVAPTTIASDPCFTGKEEDVEVGLVYFGKRFYSSHLGRWLSPDPLGLHDPFSEEGADLNLYAYVRGRALANVDPMGLADTRAHTSDGAKNKERATAEFQSGVSAGRFQYGLEQAYGAARDEIESRSAPVASQGGAQGASGQGETSLAEFEQQRVADLKALDTWYKSQSKQVGASVSATYQKGYAQGYAERRIDDRTKTALEAATYALPVAAKAAGAAVRGLATAAALRTRYVQTAQELGAMAQRLRGSGMSAEQVVRTVSPVRNELKLNTREQGSWLVARAADVRNLVVYGNRAGPSPEQLFQRYGSWDKALEAISRTSPTVNRMAGAKQ